MYCLAQIGHVIILREVPRIFLLPFYGVYITYRPVSMVNILYIELETGL